MSAFIGLGLVACGGIPTVDDLQGVVIENPTPKPSFTLNDTDAVPYDFAERTEGKLTLLYFGYTRCPDVCPVHLAQIAQALSTDEGQAAATEVVFVSVDPDYDTGKVLRAYLDNFSTEFVGLTGSYEELSAVGEAMGMPVVNPNDPEIADLHPAWVIAYAPDGLNYAIYPFGTTQDQWDNDLPILRSFQ